MWLRQLCEPLALGPCSPGAEAAAPPAAALAGPGARRGARCPARSAPGIELHRQMEEHRPGRLRCFARVTPSAASQGSEREVGVVAGGSRCRRSTRNRGVPACAPAGIPGVDQPRHTERAPRDAVLPARGSPGDAVAPGGHVGAACLGGGFAVTVPPTCGHRPRGSVNRAAFWQPPIVQRVPFGRMASANVAGGQRGPWIVVRKGHGGGMMFHCPGLDWARRPEIIAGGGAGDGVFTGCGGTSPSALTPCPGEGTCASVSPTRNHAREGAFVGQFPPCFAHGGLGAGPGELTPVTPALGRRHMLCPALKPSQLPAPATTAAIVCRQSRASTQLPPQGGRVQPAGDKWTLYPRFGLVVVAFFFFNRKHRKQGVQLLAFLPAHFAASEGKKYFFKAIAWLFFAFFPLFFLPFFALFPMFFLFFVFFLFLGSLPTVAVDASPRRGCVYPSGTVFGTGAGLLWCVNMWREPRDSTSKHPLAGCQHWVRFFSLRSSSQLPPGSLPPKRS